MRWCRFKAVADSAAFTSAPSCLNGERQRPSGITGRKPWTRLQRQARPPRCGGRRQRRERRMGSSVPRLRSFLNAPPAIRLGGDGNKSTCSAGARNCSRPNEPSWRRRPKISARQNRNSGGPSEAQQRSLRFQPVPPTQGRPRPKYSRQGYEG